MADGFSCKEQIAQSTNRHALHLAEVLQMGLRAGMEEIPTMYPENHSVKARQTAQGSSMRRAGAITLGALIAAAAGLAWLRTRSA